MECDERLTIGMPDPDELEITTIGPGKANGESILVHLGSGEWMIVDSCISGEIVLPLYYLCKIGVSPLQVTKVICTHWHTDHVRGMPKVLEECKNALLAMAPVSDRKGNLSRILKLAGLKTVNSNVWNIFDACLAELAKNGRPQPDYLFKNVPVIVPKAGPVEMNAVGPADIMLDNFLVSLANLTPDNPNVAQVENLEGNLCSLALAMRFGDQKVLLGGDMETGRSDKYNHGLCAKNCATHSEDGWCDAINGIAYQTCKPFNLVKLPHHSSENAYCPIMWKTDMVSPIAVTTSFQNTQSENHPRKAMLNEYLQYCSKLYSTCGIDAAVAATDESGIHDFNDDEDVQVVDRIEEGIGIVVCRWKKDIGWREYCFGEGSLVNQQYLSNYHQ